MVEHSVIVLRADASSAMGVGHVMRSLALAEALNKVGVTSVLASSELPNGLKAQALQIGVAVVDINEKQGSEKDASATLEIAMSALVVDGYHFSHNFYSKIESHGTKLIVIDDNADKTGARPSLVLNQNPHARAQMYDFVVGRPKLLLGLHFALIRSDVLCWLDQKIAPDVDKVFISLGGGDLLGLTASLVNEISSRGHRIVVAIGPANLRRQIVERAVAGSKNARIIEQSSYAQELATSTLAIIGAGGSLWEAACLGIPSISLLVAQNQVQAVSAADSKGFTMMIDAQNAFDPSVVGMAVDNLLGTGRAKLDRMRLQAKISVDGGGASRVAHEILQVLHG